MNVLLKSAITATWITGVASFAIWLGLALPFEVLNGIAFWLVEIPLLFAYFLTGLPLGTGNNGFLVPNAFGYSFLVLSLWVISFALAVVSRLLSKRSATVLREAQEIHRRSLPNTSLERTREE